MVTMRTLPTEELPVLGFLDLGVTLSHSNPLKLKMQKPLILGTGIGIILVSRSR